MKVGLDCKNWYKVTLFMMGFLARRQRWFAIASLWFCLPCPFVHLSLNLREVTNSSHLVKVDTDFYLVQRSRSGANLRPIDYLPVLPPLVIRLTFTIYLWYNVPGRKIYGLNVLFVCGFYLSIYGIYIAPLQGNYSEALPAQARAKRKASAAHDFGLLRAYTERSKLPKIVES